MRLKTLTSILRTGLPIVVELIHLVNSVIIFLSQMTLLRWLTFLFGSQNVILISLLYWIFFFLVLQYFSLWEILIMLLSQFPLTFYQIHNGMPCFIASLMTILVLIRAVFVIIWEMFHGRISAAASEFCEWVQVEIDVYILHRKYQVKPPSSPWFSTACAVAIVHRNHFFSVWTRRINLLILR